MPWDFKELTVAKVKLDVGATVDFLDKDEMNDVLADHRAAAEAKEYERLKGIKYIRAPRIQGTVVSGTIGYLGGTVFPQTGTLYGIIGGPPWGPLQGYSWSVRRIAVGGLANVNGTNPDTVGIYRNTNTSPLIDMVTANTPSKTYPTLGFVLHGGDSIVIGHVGSQVASNNFGTLASSFIAVDFDVIEIPTEMLGKLA